MHIHTHVVICTGPCVVKCITVRCVDDTLRVLHSFTMKPAIETSANYATVLDTPSHNRRHWSTSKHGSLGTNKTQPQPHLDVLTAQNLQPRVHVSPISMMVAVAVWPSPPPQHSPMFGQRASSQTVCSLSSRSLPFISVYFSPPGIARFIQSGFRTRSCVSRQLLLEQLTACAWYNRAVYTKPVMSNSIAGLYTQLT